MIRSTLLSMLLIGASTILLAGCGELKQARNDVKKSSDTAKKQLKKLQQHAAVDPLVNQKFEAIRAAYVAYYNEFQKGPANWDELIEGSRLILGQESWIREAKREGYVIVWNIPVGKLVKEEDAMFLMVYEKQAPKRGGWVMLVDDQREKMSQEDFEYFQKREMPKN